MVVLQRTLKLRMVTVVLIITKIFIYTVLDFIQSIQTSRFIVSLRMNSLPKSFQTIQIGLVKTN